VASGSTTKLLEEDLLCFLAVALSGKSLPSTGGVSSGGVTTKRSIP